MTIKLYDLCAENPGVRFSPPCWLVKLGLLHKGLDFETVPLGFAEKENYPDPEYGLLPVIDDGGAIVRDSAAILQYLDASRPERPIFPDAAARASFAFMQSFCGGYLFPSLAPKLFIHVHGAIAPRDKAFFRDKRELRLGTTLEAAATKDVAGPLATAFSVLARPLETVAWFGGDQPGAPDYALASVFLWERSIAPGPVVDRPAALEDWFGRVLDLYGGYGRRAATV